MAQVGNLLRQAALHEALGAQLCKCGHRRDNHRELLADITTIVEGALVETPNPDYRPLHFHCHSCDCVRSV